MSVYPYQAHQIVADAEDSLTKLSSWIASGSTVLDLGSGSGDLGKHLNQRKSCVLDGVEYVAEAAEQSRAWYRQVWVADLERAELGTLLGERRYDIIVCADVLEHLRDPQSVLGCLPQFLADNGRILLSIPNVGHVGVLAELLNGQFRYRDYGLLDRTHLRFFTRDSLMDLVEASNLAVTRFDRVFAPIGKTEFAAYRLNELPAAMADFLLARPDAFTYQFLLEAAPKDSVQGVVAPAPRENRDAVHQFVAKVYWRAGGQGFQEDSHSPVAAPFSDEIRRLSFPIPAGIDGLNGLRFDPADRPGYLELHRLDLFDAEGARVWGLSEGLSELLHCPFQQIQFFASPESGGPLGLIVSGPAPVLELPIPDDALGRLAGGGRLEVDLSWPTLATYHRRTEQDKQGLRLKLQGIDTRLKAVNQALEGARSEIAQKAGLVEQLNQAIVGQQEHSARLSERFAAQCTALEAQVVDGTERLAAANARLAQLTAELNQARSRNQALQAQSAVAQSQLDAVLASTSWRVTAPLRKVMMRVRGAREVSPPAASSTSQQSAVSARAPVVVRAAPSDVAAYRQWLAHFDTFDGDDERAIESAIAAFPKRPTISIVTPVYRTPLVFLRKAVDSVRRQSYPNWQLCLVDDASGDAALSAYLDEIAAADPRIRVKNRSENGHISVASNDALAMADGDYVAFLDHDDELARHALYFVVDRLNRDPRLRLVYSDEDKMDEAGARFDPYFKPDWNLELFRAQNYLCHLTVVARNLVEEVGGFREGFEGSQDWDLFLRLSERLSAAEIHHIPRVLYHWRAISGSTALRTVEKDYIGDTSLKALEEHLYRTHTEARAERNELGYFRIHYQLPDPPPKVSLVIPTRDRAGLLATCVDSILDKTRYDNYEILIADNDSTEPETKALFDRLCQNPHVRVLHCPGPFNFSAINNLAVSHTEGDIVGLLNNDLEVTHGNWLEEMVSRVLQPGVGIVGAKLYYDDRRIQHAGVVTGIGGVAGHIYKRREHNFTGIMGRAMLAQDMSAVTAACLLVRRAVYDEVQGLDETELAVAFNDVDFCLKVGAHGYRIVWTPFAELIHHESVSRGLEDTPEKRQRFAGEVRVMQERWGAGLAKDPAFNANFSLESEDPLLAFPPRLDTPWKTPFGGV